ncbi:NAD-dependent protein deacetylase sirtuin-1 isoform X1 [Manis pentadactyla]|uniref:NAD-dependent protein deacetylase sirtuin-1 isoform X1 n=1 Tax=Manis pentadactyla TaxID=143292 RepID=UPI001876455B|nr:NAD-dependent protein deacetylase sirtuin-1 isoform X1 [Manis pentadactyla]KAI5154845.1 Nad-Dependent Protein Deacetylase Sirtuin-1 [Manis pentadactyla]
MADEVALALQPGGSTSAAAAEREATSPPAGEPLLKKPRRDGLGRSPGEPERELPGAAGGCRAAALWREEAAGGEREAQATAAGEEDNGLGLQGLSREPPSADDLYDDDDEGEEEEEAAAAAAIGYRDNLLFGDEIITNGFHSCESDEDDRASHASSSDWTPRPRIGPYTFVQQHLMIGTDPRTILKDLLPETIPPPELDDMTLWQIVINILSEPPKRKKRKDINTIEDAVKLLQECKKIIVLTGAGVSVSCGIPDFRSRDGIYARLAIDFPDLPDPQAMFDIEYFRKDPRPFFKFAKEIYPGQFQPSLCHKFIALSDKEGKLLRNYTQNIDTLEQVAGIQRIIQCHGSFATASCLICKYKVDCEAVRGDIFNQVVPRCPRCPADEPLAIMKPEIVFFGENLPEQFHRAMKYDKDEVDLLIVIGSSLKVRPVALIPSSIPHEVPQILINREPLPHLHFDVELLGDCDVIINELCHRLGGEYAKLCCNPVKLSEITEKPQRTQKEGHLSQLPPTPLNISEDSSTPERTSPDSSEIVTLLDQTTESNVDKDGPESKDQMEEKSQEVKTYTRNIESVTEQLEGPDLKNVGSSSAENSQRTSVAETVRKCWPARLGKQQISKRLDGNQYLFLPPNRYIFHGAEVYSDSEDDVLSSSSCGSNSDSGTCQSPSLEEPMEDESETEEFYNGLEDDADVNERAGGIGLGADGGDQEAVIEAVATKQEATNINYPNKS